MHQMKNLAEQAQPAPVKTFAELRTEHNRLVDRFQQGADVEAEVKSSAFTHSHRETGSHRLVVMLSTTAKFTLQKYKFDADVLFLVDVSGTYFCIPCESIASLVVGLVRDFGYTEVAFVGCSKGGTGAISVARECFRLGLTAKVDIVAFSPITLVYPHHPNGDAFPSYKNLPGRLEKAPRLIPIFARTGNLLEVDYTRFNSCRVIHGAKNPVDSFEAERLKGIEGVEIIPLPTGQHYTLGFYTIPHDVDIEHARAKFAEVDDPDVVAVRTDNAIEEYLSLSKSRGLSLSGLLG